MIHHMLIGTWLKPGAIFTVAFDDENLTLDLVKRTEIPKDEPISWIAFDHAKKNIYGASMKKYSSFKINSPTDIVHETSHPMSHVAEASLATTNTRAIFLLPARLPPYAVYGNPFYNHASHGNIFSVSPTGTLSENIQNYPYLPHTGIHGMVFDSSESYLYSADLKANKIWTHKKDMETGTVELVGSVDAPEPGDHPRWVDIHPNNGFLYVLMEAGNNLAVYSIDAQTHLPTFTGVKFPLIPPGYTHPKFAKQFRSDVVFVSPSAKYLFASTRSNTPGPLGLTGYLSAFKLADDGSVERQICMMPTPTSGGHSNAFSFCPGSDEWIALTDDERGGVEIYRWKDEFLARVCRLELSDEMRKENLGFGMNAIWYD